ncbi:MAG: hypothetical protein JST65_04955 [Acidobacteria bacterium]|nr:hypothetical protein [Acidobacteriota bacterium]
MGIDLDAVQVIRPILVKELSQHAWNEEERWDSEEEVLRQYKLAQWFLLEKNIPLAFKHWFYGWQWHNALLRRFQFTDLWRFLSFYRQNRASEWAVRHVTPWMDTHYLPSYRALETLRGLGEPWLPQYILKRDTSSGRGDLVDICQEHLQVWQLRKAMTLVIANAPRSHVAEIDREFSDFCTRLGHQPPERVELLFSPDILANPSLFTDLGTTDLGTVGLPIWGQ